MSLGRPVLSENTKLTEKQIAFVDHYLSAGCTPTEAARAVGYATPTVEAYRLTRLPHIRRAIQEARERLIDTEGATVAYGTLMDCMKPGNPGSVRVAAAKLVWQAAGVLEKHGAAGDKPLQEMTADELRSVIDACDGAMAKVADGARLVKPAVIDG